MVRDFTSFAVLIVFVYCVAAALPGLAQLIHGNQSAIVAATERN